MDKPKRGSSSPLIPLSPKHSKNRPSSVTHIDNRIHKNPTSVSCMESPSNSPKPSSQSGRSGIHRHSIASDVSDHFMNEHNRSTRRSKECFSDRVSNVSACSSARSFESRKTNETRILESRKSFSHSPVKFPDKAMRRVSSSPLSQQKHPSSRVSNNSTTKTLLRTPKKSSDEVSETGSTDTTPRLVRRSNEKPPRTASDKNLNKQEVSRKAVIEKDDENGSFLLPDHNAQFSSDNPEVGLLLLKMAQALHTSGENPLKARFYALKAAEFFENFTVSDVTLELVISLHLLAASCCKLGQYEEAIPVLKRSLSIFSSELDAEHALAAFAGYMQLGDTYSLVGQYENALNSYHAGLEIQKLVLGVMDPQVSETCRYIAESHLQVMQFTEAEELCDQALNIHGESNTTGTLQEAADRRLMALILSGKGDHEGALQNLVLASAALLANGKEIEVAFVDCSIGDSYVALGHFDEAIFSYHKALAVFKSEYGEGHTTVASVYASLADLYLRTGRFSEAKSHCENALIIYGRQGAAHSSDEIATGLTEIAGLFESMGENKQALSLLQKALEIMENTPGQQSAVSGIEAQMGVLFYLTGKYEEAYMVFNRAVSKLTFGASKKTWLLGIQNPGYQFQAIVINEKPTSVHSYRSKQLTKTRSIQLPSPFVCKNSNDHEAPQNNSTAQEMGTQRMDCSNIDNNVSSRREAILKPLLALSICSMHSIAKAETAQLDSVKNPEQLGLDKMVDPVKEPEQLEPNMKKLASMESNKSNSRIYDATVIGEPVAIGKDRQRVWNKLLGARIVYLGEAEHVPDPDDKAIELEIVQNLRDNCFEQQRPISLALQAFPSNLQPQLNEYMNQRINDNDLKSFISHWPAQQWEEYKPLLQYCCRNGVRLIACGAPLEILRKVESKGVQGLTAVERRKYVPPLGAGFIANSSSISRRLPLNSIFPQASFSFGPGSYLFAQARMVEDYTMSQLVTQAMVDGGSVGLLVVITGASHVLLGTRGGGLPARISKKLPKKTQAVVLLNPERQHIRNEGEVPIADFLWYSAAKLCTRNCFDRAEIARIMDAAGRRRDALPQDLQKGLDLGLVSPEVLQSFLDLEKQPFIAELTHHFQGFRERWLADPRFLQRLALEETICITATLIAQYERRKGRFIEELDYVISDSLRSAVVSFFAVWLPAPTLSFLSYEEKIDTSGIIDGLKGLLGSFPDNAFQRNGPGKNWDLRARMTAVLMIGIKLFCVGFVSSIATVSVTNTLFTIRQQWRTGVARHDVKTKSPVLKTALVYGSFLGTSANLRYQFVAGIVEHWGADYVLASQPFLGNIVSFLARVINSYFGTRQWIDLARLTGLQQSKAEPENLSCKPLNHPPEQLEGGK